MKANHKENGTEIMIKFGESAHPVFRSTSGSIWWFPYVLRRHQNNVTNWGVSQDGGPGSVEGCVRNDCRHSCDWCSLFLLMLVRWHWVRLGSLFCLRWVWLLFLDNWRVPGSHKTGREMLEVHLQENLRKSPSWYQTSWRTMPTSERGRRDWEGRATHLLGRRCGIKYEWKSRKNWQWWRKEI